MEQNLAALVGHHVMQEKPCIVWETKSQGESRTIPDYLFPWRNKVLDWRRVEIWPDYPGDDGQAARVVARMRELGYDYGTQWLVGQPFDCWFGAANPTEIPEGKRWGAAKREIPATAICIAALEALGVKYEEKAA